MELCKRFSVQSAASHGRKEEPDKPGTIPFDRWCKIVRENKVNKIKAIITLSLLVTGIHSL